MQSLGFYLLLLLWSLLFLALASLLSFFRFRTEMKAVKHRLGEESKLLRTPSGTWEYSVIEDFDIPANMDTPAWIIHSRNDGLVSYTHAIHAHRSIKNSRLLLYDHGGHGALSALEVAREQIGHFVQTVP